MEPECCRPAVVMCARIPYYTYYISARPYTGGPFSMRLIDLNVSAAETIHNKNNTFRIINDVLWRVRERKREREIFAG